MVNVTLIHSNGTYPKMLQKLLDKDECKLGSDTKDLVKVMLEFEPKKRVRLKYLHLQNVLQVWLLPSGQEEGVMFEGVPDFTIEGKCKCSPIGLGGRGQHQGQARSQLRPGHLVPQHCLEERVTERHQKN
jgi:hypothetical protein